MKDACMYVIDAFYELAEKHCPGEYEISMRRNNIGLVTFRLIWRRSPGQSSMHYQAVMDEPFSLSAAMWIAEKAERDLEEQFVKGHPGPSENNFS